MSTAQEKTINLLEDIASQLRKVNANLPPAEPKGVLGGNLLSALPLLDGWNYFVQNLPGPKVLRRGEPVQVFPDWKDEEGFFISGQIGGTDPDIHVNGAFDNLQLMFSIRQVQVFSDVAYGSQWFKVNCYNPVIPLFAITFGVQPLAPYNKRTAFNIFLGTESAQQTCVLTLCTFTKIIISDRKAFYRSMKRLALQQSVGIREVNVKA